MQTDYSEIVVDIHDHALWIGINRPEVLNAFREQTLDELATALTEVRSHPELVAVVIYGVDGNFSAGGDMRAMLRLNHANSEQWNERMLRLAMLCRGASVPVIAMVDGYCVGGGHELMLWCDLVVTSNEAIFGQTGAKVGACPTVGATQYISRLIGERRAKEMIFLCKRYTGAEAAQLGLANIAVESSELLETVTDICHQLSQYSGQTIRATKVSLNFEGDQLYASWQHGMELLANIWGSEESVEGMTAFLERRSPDFMKFRYQRQAEMETWQEGFDEGLNQSSKSKAARGDKASAIA